MSLTKVSTDGVKDDAITKAKIPADQIEASELANNAVDTNAIQDLAVTEDKLGATSVTASKIAQNAVSLDKLPLGNNTVDGKFLRANNGSAPTFETVDLANLSASNLTSGTIPDARFPATLPTISGANLTDVGKLVFMDSATSSSDITTSSDNNAASGLSITWTPKSASNKFIFMVQGGAQQGQSSNTRGAQSLYMDVGNGSGASFYGYIGAYQYNTAFYVPNSGCFVGDLTGYPGSGTATASLYIREQGGNETYTLHDNEGGLSNNVYIFLMEIEP